MGVCSSSSPVIITNTIISSSYSNGSHIKRLMTACLNAFCSIPSLSYKFLNTMINNHIRNGGLINTHKVLDEIPRCCCFLKFDAELVFGNRSNSTCLLFIRRDARKRCRFLEPHADMVPSELMLPCWFNVLFEWKGLK